MSFPLYFKILHKIGHLVTSQEFIQPGRNILKTHSSHQLFEPAQAASSTSSTEHAQHQARSQGPAHSGSPPDVLAQEKISLHPLQTHPVRNESTSNHIMIPTGTEMTLPRLQSTPFYIISFEAHSYSPKDKKNNYLMSHMQSVMLDKHTFPFI